MTEKQKGRIESKSSDTWKHAVAGCTAGLSTVLALQPLDVIKTRLQVQDGAAGSTLPVYRGTRDALRSIFKDEGWRALYAGLTPALVGSGVAWGIYFFAYNSAKDRYRELTGQKNLGPLIHLASAAEAGSLVCFVTNPIWVVKTRLQLQRQHAFSAISSASPSIAKNTKNTASSLANTTLTSNISTTSSSSSSTVARNILKNARTIISASTPIPRNPLSQPPSYSGFLDCLTQIAKTEGLPGLYKGLVPSLFLVSHGAIQFTVYEELKSATYHLRHFIRPLGSIIPSSSDRLSSDGATHNKDDYELTSAEITACGALSKLAASIVTYPSQVVRSRLQQRMDARSLKYTGVINVLRTTLAREGIPGLYKGLLPNVLRVMPQSALTFLVYESVMKQLKTKF